MSAGGAHGPAFISILMELEKLTGVPTAECYDYMFGCSISATIVLFLALDESKIPKEAKGRRLDFLLEKMMEKTPALLWDGTLLGRVKVLFRRGVSEKALEEFLKKFLGMRLSRIAPNPISV